MQHEMLSKVTATKCALGDDENHHAICNWKQNKTSMQQRLYLYEFISKESKCYNSHIYYFFLLVIKTKIINIWNKIPKVVSQ